MNGFFESLDKLDGFGVISFLIDLVENTCEAEDANKYDREMARCLLAGLLAEQIDRFRNQMPEEIT